MNKIHRSHVLRASIHWQQWNTLCVTAVVILQIVALVLPRWVSIVGPTIPVPGDNTLLPQNGAPPGVALSILVGLSQVCFQGTANDQMAIYGAFVPKSEVDVCLELNTVCGYVANAPKIDDDVMLGQMSGARKVCLAIKTTRTLFIISLTFSACTLVITIFFHSIIHCLGRVTCGRLTCGSELSQHVVLLIAPLMAFMFSLICLLYFQEVTEAFDAGLQSALITENSLSLKHNRSKDYAWILSIIALLLIVVHCGSRMIWLLVQHRRGALQKSYRHFGDDGQADEEAILEPDLEHGDHGHAMTSYADSHHGDSHGNSKHSDSESLIPAARHHDHMIYDASELPGAAGQHPGDAHRQLSTTEHHSQITSVMHQITSVMHHGDLANKHGGILILPVSASMDRASAVSELSEPPASPIKRQRRHVEHRREVDGVITEHAHSPFAHRAHTDDHAFTANGNWAHGTHSSNS